MSISNPKKLVEEGYDRLAEKQSKWAAGIRRGERWCYVSYLLENLQEGADVLELGCGSGSTSTRKLAECFSLTGVDISQRQIEQAKKQFPSTRFIHADMTGIQFPPESLDGVCAFYSLIHLPRQELPGMLNKISIWLRPGGLLIATMGSVSVEEDYQEDWLGVPMYWSSFDSSTNRRLVGESGLVVDSAKEETAEEFGKPVTFLWVIAHKPEHCT